MTNQPLSNCRAVVIIPPKHTTGLYLAYLNAKCTELTKLQKVVDAKLKVLCGDKRVDARLVELKREAHELFLLMSSMPSRGIKVDLGGETSSVREMLDERPETLSRIDNLTLKKYYRRLASKYHPRALKHDPAKAERFALITKAYKAGSLELLYLFLATESWQSLDEDTLQQMISRTRKKIDDLKSSAAFKVVAASIAGSNEGSILRLLEAIDQKIRVVKHQRKTAIFGDNHG